EGVEGDHRRPTLLDSPFQRPQRLLQTLGERRPAEVREENALADEARIEELELLHVAQELQGRRGDAGEVDLLLTQPRLVKEELEGNDALASPRTPREDVERAGDEASMEDTVHRGNA